MGEQLELYRINIAKCAKLICSTYDCKTVAVMAEAQKRYEQRVVDIANMYGMRWEDVREDVREEFNREYYDRDWRHEGEH